MSIESLSILLAILITISWLVPCKKQRDLGRKINLWIIKKLKALPCLKGKK